MNQIATITSKRQLTIPVFIFKKLNLKIGQKLLINIEDNVMKAEPAFNLVNKLAGSVKIPTRFKGLSTGSIIKKAKKEYFKTK